MYVTYFVDEEVKQERTSLIKFAINLALEFIWLDNLFFFYLQNHEFLVENDLVVCASCPPTINSWYLLYNINNK